jgi:hypothetical protein
MKLHKLIPVRLFQFIFERWRTPKEVIKLQASLKIIYVMTFEVAKEFMLIINFFVNKNYKCEIVHPFCCTVA